VLEIAELPIPEPGEGQVRIRVLAAAVNPVDVATRAGLLAESGLMTASGQIGIGWDLAGTVDAVGPAVASFSTGDSVIGMRDLLSAPIGAQAEYVVLDEDAVVQAPRSVSAADASTIPLNALTAWQALDLLALEPGQSLLITGAAGAVGGFALELASLRGLRTVGVARPGDEALVRRLGADEFVAHTPDLGAVVRRVIRRGVDGALDAALIGIPALDAVRDRGSFVAVAAGAAPLPLRGIRVRNVWIHSNPSQLAQLAALAEAGRLTLRVSEIQPLDQVAAAHERMAVGGLRGRIVLLPGA
jgi:NADPH:quinone reductase-like Zn-dependent oxidoreductase